MNQMLPTFPKSVQPGIPKLGRTPDGWTRYRLGDLFDAISRPVDLDDDTEYDLVTVKRSRGGIAFRERLPGRKIAVKSQFYIREGDFLISKRQIVHGACGIVSAEFDGSVVSNEYAVLRPKNMLLLEYLGYLVHSVYMQQTFFHASIGVHVEKMIFKLDDWLKWPIHLPGLDAQQKMVDAVWASDLKITALKKQRAGFEKYKLALMQKLFSGKMRFTRNDGRSFPDWREVKLGEIASTFSGGTPSVGNIRYYNGDIPFIKSAEIGRSVVEQNITECGLNACSAKLIEEGDLLYALYGATGGEVAISPIKGAINQAILCIRSDQSTEFLYQLLGYQKNRIRARYLQGGQGNLSASLIKALTLSIPILDEQRKIASCLAAFDAKLDAVDTEISIMDSFKKGLLQKLFV